MARLNAGGSVDQDFNILFDDAVGGFTVRNESEIIVSGRFRTFDGQVR